MHFAILGLVLGLGSAVSPGPLQTLVISQAVLRGWRAGALMALAPLASDLVIVVVAVGLVRLVPAVWLNGISLAGGVLVGYIAWDTGRAARRAAYVEEPALAAVADGGTARSAPPPRSRAGEVSYARAVLVNFLNPHPWLFWMVVGAPVAVRALHHGAVWGILFILMFYVGMIGLKVGLSVLADRGVEWMGSRFQVWTLRAAALGLAIVAVLLAVHGISGLIA